MSEHLRKATACTPAAPPVASQCRPGPHDSPCSPHPSGDEMMCACGCEATDVFCTLNWEWIRDERGER